MKGTRRRWRCKVGGFVMNKKRRPRRKRGRMKRDEKGGGVVTGEKTTTRMGAKGLFLKGKAVRQGGFRLGQGRVAHAYWKGITNAQ